MSDAAFKPRPFQSYSTDELRNILAARKAEGFSDDAQNSPAIRDEVARRDRVAAGDLEVMTPAERLRWFLAHPEA